MTTSQVKHRNERAEYEHQLQAYEAYEEKVHAAALQSKRDRNKAASARYYQKYAFYNQM